MNSERQRADVHEARPDSELPSLAGASKGGLVLGFEGECLQGWEPPPPREIGRCAFPDEASRLIVTVHRIG